VRPGLAVKYDTVHAKTPMLTVTGQPVTDLHGLLLEPFCSKPLPQLEVTRYDDWAQYTLSGDSVGVQSAVDLVHATLLPRMKERHRAAGEPPRRSTMAVGVSTPSRTFIFDALLHQSIYPGQEPALALYRTVGVFGSSKDTRREVDRLGVIESIQPLGEGLSRFRAAESPDYQEIVRHVCAQRGWDPSSLRGYRCCIRFPMYSAEVVMAFELPLK
jgi:hypothetical protein